MLDESLIVRAAPPGSLHYFSLLYAPEAQRAALTALLLVGAEIRESAVSANHDVAHTRLRWWRMEVDRLVNRNAQHPAARVLQATASPPEQWALLHETMSAADMDLARLTYQTLDESHAYAARSGGALLELAALQLLAPAPVDPSVRSAVNRLGGALRQVDMLRDVRQDCREGRCYLPLDLLQRHASTPADLQPAQFSAAAQAALRDYGSVVLQRLDAAVADLPATSHAPLRPLLVLAALQRRLLLQLMKHPHRLASERMELGPLAKPWIAWRAALRAR